MSPAFWAGAVCAAIRPTAVTRSHAMKGRCGRRERSPRRPDDIIILVPRMPMRIISVPPSAATSAASPGNSAVSSFMQDAAGEPVRTQCGASWVRAAWRLRHTALAATGAPSGAPCRTNSKVVWFCLEHPITDNHGVGCLRWRLRHGQGRRRSCCLQCRPPAAVAASVTRVDMRETHSAHDVHQTRRQVPPPTGGGRHPPPIQGWV